MATDSLYKAGMTLFIAVVLITIGTSAMCSLLEATLLSTRVATLEAAKIAGKSSADRLLAMKADIAGPTAAILVLNTVANTAGAAVAGSLAVTAFGADWLVVFSAVFTVSILVFSEIVPKTIGAVHWRSIWPAIVWPIIILQRLLLPLVWLTQHLSRILSPKLPGPATTEDEIAAMIRMGARVGQLSSVEYELMTRALSFDEMRVGAVMVPRRDVIVVSPTLTLEQTVNLVRHHKHTRYPLCDDQLEVATRFVHTKDVLGAERSEPLNLAKISRPLERVPDSMPAPALLRRMQISRRHMALVIDEHGTAVGIVTLEDLLEQIIGVVDDEFDERDLDYVDQSDGSHQVKADMSIRRFEELLALPISSQPLAETLNGYIAQVLGRVPVPGDRVQYAQGVTLEVRLVELGRASLLRLTREDSAGPGTGQPPDDPGSSSSQPWPPA